MVEDELGGHLRGLEFIYKEPGVNRPLTGKDSEDKNTNRTNYRNQINKVANAIKEIILGLKTGSAVPVNEMTEQEEIFDDIVLEDRRLAEERPLKLAMVKSDKLIPLDMEEML